jgi:Chromate transporter
MGGRLKELALLFLKLGTVAFGGPAAHVAMMEDEVVLRRRWLSYEDFLDLFPRRERHRHQRTWLAGRWKPSQPVFVLSSLRCSPSATTVRSRSESTCV